MVLRSSVPLVYTNTFKYLVRSIDIKVRNLLEGFSEREKNIWIAMGIDCEGSINIKKTNTWRQAADAVTIQIVVDVSNTKQEMLEEIQKHFGGIKQPTSVRYGTNKEAERILLRALPYLLIKRLKAEIALKFIEQRKRVWKLGNAEKGFSVEDIDLVKRLYLANRGKIPEWVDNVKVYGPKV